MGQVAMCCFWGTVQWWRFTFFLHLSKKFFTLTWLVFWTGFSIGWGILQLSSVAWPRKIHATLGNPGATVTRKPNAPDSVRGTTILARLTRFPSLLTRCGVPKKPTSQTSYTGVFKLIMATEILLRNINKMQFGLVLFGTNPNLNRNVRYRNPACCSHLSMKPWLERETKVSRNESHDK